MCDYRGGFGVDIAFIDHLYTRLGTTSNYSAAANLHSSQITRAPAKPFPAFCAFNRRPLVTASNRDSSVSTLMIYLNVGFLPNIFQLSSSFTASYTELI
jgi:hypothetical protein